MTRTRRRRGVVGVPGATVCQLVTDGSPVLLMGGPEPDRRGRRWRPPSTGKEYP